MKYHISFTVFLFSLLTLFVIVSPAQPVGSKQAGKAQLVGFSYENRKTATVNRAPVENVSNAPNLQLEQKIMELINAQRAANGLETLRWSDEVALIARRHSENMAKYSFFDHYDKEGLRVDGRADNIGLSEWRSIGENIAYNRGYQNPLEFACESWMKSPSHRDNILKSKWKETGIGIAIAPDGTYYFTQVFLLR